MLLLILALILVPNSLAVPPPPSVEFDFSALPLKLPLKQRDPGASISLEGVSADCEVFRVRVGMAQSVEGQSRQIQDGVNIVDITELFVEQMARLGINAEVLPDKNTIRIKGWPDKKGFPRAVIAGRVYTRGLKSDQLPKVKNPPAPPVVFDLSPLPRNIGRTVKLTFQVSPADGGEPVRESIEYDKLERRADLAETVAARFTKAGLKAEAVKEKVRIVGWVGKDGKVSPAVDGKATSKELVPDEMPRVTGLPPAQPCVVFDLTPVPTKPMQKFTMNVEIKTVKGGETFREKVELDNGKGSPSMVTALADRLLKDGFYAEREGNRVLVYGWVSDKPGKAGRLFAVTGGKVESEQLKPDQLPKVTNPRKP